MEYRAIELVNNNQVAEAVKLLESMEYWDQKEIYDNGLKDYATRKMLGHGETIQATTKKIDAIAIDTSTLVSKSKFLMFKLLFVILSVALLISFVISYFIANPLARLRDAITKISNGDLDIDLDIRTGDEIENLAVSFSKMVADLKNTTVSLHELKAEVDARKSAESEKESIVKFPEENPNPVLRIAIDGKLLFMNSAAESALKIKAGQHGPGERMISVR